MTERSVPAATEPITTHREVYIDLLRAFSMLVVVVFHWVFTVLEFGPDFIRVNSPIGSTPGVWILTWVLQVMPLFFFVGGYAHWIVWKKTQERGGGWWTFVQGRLRRLVFPALAVGVVWVIIGTAIGALRDIHWLGEAVLLIVSPLWFLGIYTTLVVIAPVAIWAHKRWGPIVLVFLVGLAAVLDTVRFAHDQEWAGYLNFLVFWGFCHQLGLMYRPLSEAARQVAWSMLWGGVFGLVALTNFGLYPRSMVGVPGDRFSNMGPPTLVIVSLVVLQVGVAMLVRPFVVQRLAGSVRWQHINEVANGASLPMYLFHTSGFAIAVTLVYWGTGYVLPAETTAEWWLQRPVWLVLPAMCTVPLIAPFVGRITSKQREMPVLPTPEEAHRAERFW